VKELLSRWNRLPHKKAVQSILACCGSRAWANAMVLRRPFDNVGLLLDASREIWWSLGAKDWMEAFGSHPRIGESSVATSASAKSKEWSSQEQELVNDDDEATTLALADGNRQYEERFGRIFIICASGKSRAEMLTVLKQRLLNDDSTELREAVEEQQKITQIRLRKWLEE
jgi:2-oxo-4-hydroxy-4-carboxy-5-ureidoimidazoline decarboxylase